jgi:hypothetical protein
VDASGYPNFINAGAGLSVNIAATVVNVLLTAANGIYNMFGKITTDAIIGSLANNTTNYLYADIGVDETVTLGATTLAPNYQFGGTYSTTANQFTFNICDMVGKVGNGSTAAQAYRVFIGEAVTSGGTVTSVTNYALQGRYVSTEQTMTINSLLTVNHNLGVLPRLINAPLICKTAEASYVVGDIVHTYTSSYSGGIYNGASCQKTNKSIIFIQPQAYIVFNKSSYAYANCTVANWRIILEVFRGW